MLKTSPLLKKIVKQPLGAIGIVIITLALIVSILGYIITPDKTNNANAINLPIALLKPGDKVTFFETGNDAPSNLASILFGSEHTVKSIAIKDYKINGDTALLNLYNGGLSENIYEKVVLSKSKDPYRIRTQTFWLGTDGLGRDLLSRLILGTRISLSVGIVSVILSLLIGTLLGLMAGYFRGKTDLVISWFMNVIWSLPTMLLVVAISFALGKGFWQIFIAIGLSSWVEVARVVRGQVFSIREKEYIQAAKVLGFSSWRIMLKHILPNLKSSLIVLAVANFGSAILLESGLSFLGLGVAPPVPSWGIMIKEYYSYIMFDSAYLAIVPGMAIMFLVIAFNFIGIALRDALDINLS